MRTLYNLEVLRGIFSPPDFKRAKSLLTPGRSKSATPAKRSGSGASQPRSFLTAPGGDQTFGGTAVKRRALLGVS